MFNYQESHFGDLCRDQRVATQVAALATNRGRAVRQFWLYLIGGLAVTIVVGGGLISAGWPTTAVFLGLFLLVGTIIMATIPLGNAGDAIKHPVLQALAETGGLSYTPADFAPPVYDAARPALFGNWLSSQSFTDLFTGTDPDGRRVALYEANLTRKQGKYTTTIFSGQIYAWERPGRTSAEIVIIPDRSIFNFFKPLSGMERVKFESDPDFERSFEVYAYRPPEAAMLVDTDLRRTLLDLRQEGRVFAYIGTENVLVASSGRNRFEAGSMLKATAAEQRVRAMFDDVCAGMTILKRLRAAVG